MKKFKDHIKSAADAEKARQAAIEELKPIAKQIISAGPYQLEDIYSYKSGLKKKAKLPVDSYLGKVDVIGTSIFVEIERFFTDGIENGVITLYFIQVKKEWKLAALFSNKFDPESGEHYPYYLK